MVKTISYNRFETCLLVIFVTINMLMTYNMLFMIAPKLRDELIERNINIGIAFNVINKYNRAVFAMHIAMTFILLYVAIIVKRLYLMYFFTSISLLIYVAYIILWTFKDYAAQMSACISCFRIIVRLAREVDMALILSLHNRWRKSAKASRNETHFFSSYHSRWRVAVF